MKRVLKTHCVNGHELSGANVRIGRAGTENELRVCRTCHRMWNAAHRQQINKAARAKKDRIRSGQNTVEPPFISAASLTYKPRSSLSDQIRAFLADEGRARPSEICKGIARRNGTSHRLLDHEVFTRCYAMSRAGSLIREFIDGKCFYMLAKPEEATTARGLAHASRMADVLQAMANRVAPELRSMVLSELFVLAASGKYRSDEHDRLLNDAREAAKRSLRNGWRETGPHADETRYVAEDSPDRFDVEHEGGWL